MSRSQSELDIESQLERRRAAVAAEWQQLDTVVLVGAGELIHRPGRDDSAYPFESHSEYFYLTDRNSPGGVLVFDPVDGWTDFQTPITVEDRLWSGAPDGDADAPTTDQLEAWLDARSSRRRTWLGSPPAEAVASADAVTAAEVARELRFGLADVRRIKDAVELERMRAAEQATEAAFAVAVPLLREGASEREVQIELEAEALRHGAEAMAYDTIIGGGPNSAVLHFAPTARRFQSQELVLIDAGAQYRGYASDITRTYPVGGEFSGIQADVHGVVHAAERAAIDHCLRGSEWRDVHLVAALSIAEGLAQLGLLRGEAEELVASGAVWLFFPHGIGHLVGLGVRDAGGVPLRARRDEPKPYPNLRINLPLEVGMVVTVEPGVYFVPAILNDSDNRREHPDAVAWDRVDPLIGLGGIRIEDNVLITDGGHEIITAGVPVLG